MRVRNVNIGKVAWILGATIAVVALVFMVAGERMEGLGLVAFLLIIFGLIMEHDANEQVKS